MAFDITLSPTALEQLTRLTARDRRIVLDEIEAQLKHEPTTITRQRKPLRPNPLASWELRVGKFRVYYQVEQDERDIVFVIAVGKKIRNQVVIGETKVQL